jgi:hypothetical protein
MRRICALHPHRQLLQSGSMEFATIRHGFDDFFQPKKGAAQVKVVPV